MKLSCILLSFFLLATTSTLLHAQASDTILPNPNAVLLRKIWMVQGETTGPNAGGMVGEDAGNLSDITGDSLNDFIIHFGKSAIWKIYSSRSPSPDTTAIWQTIGYSTAPVTPSIGSFWDDDRRMLWIALDTCDDQGICLFRLLFFAVENGTVADTPSLTLNTGIQFCPRGVFACDLDNDGDDELVLTRSCSYPEIWMYEGGSNFTTAAPTMKIGDPDDNSSGLSTHNTVIADVDGDHRLDMVTAAGYIGKPKLKIWYGREGSPWNWTSTPDRVILLGNTIGLNMPLTFADYDGDSILDFAGRVFQIENPGVFVYLSGSGKNFRTRSFSLDDAEVYFRTSEYGPLGSGGYLNDPRRKHEMLALYGPKPRPLLFSATKDGIDPYYDAYFAGGLEEEMGYKIRVPLPDCNGDGWGDFLTADDSWWGFDQGIAMILAGGPYIPHDDPTVDVQELPAEGKPNAISIWPNPVRDVLNIAWHGRLQHSPARLTIHDVNGQLVASGVSDPSVGAMLWNANGVAGGTYLLTVYDREGRVIVSTGFIKQE